MNSESYANVIWSIALTKSQRMWLSMLMSGSLWKEELVSNKIGFWVEEITKQRIKGEALLLLTPYNKT